jgi:hypothetical protein
LLYFGGGDGNTALFTSVAGEQLKSFELPSKVNLTGMVGAPGDVLLAYSTAEPSQDSGTLVSEIFVASYPDLTTSEAVMKFDSVESYILVPVAIRVSGDAAVGVWYTNSLWGIGGDIFVEPRGGLTYLDLETGERIEYIPIDERFLALSSDQTTAAITLSGQNTSLNVVDITTGRTISFPTMPGGERGVAHVQISPGNRYLAWMEGRGGEWDGNLEATIRVGDLSGEIVAEYPGSSLAPTIGLEPSLIPVPQGWLDDQTLLVGIYEAGKGKNSNPVIVRLDPHSGEMSFFSRGFVAGFGYFTLPVNPDGT